MERKDYKLCQFIKSTVNITDKIIADCNTIAFYNQGTTTVLIDNNSLILQPGQGWTDEAYPGEMNVREYSITFVAGSGGPNPVNNLLISRKVY